MTKAIGRSLELYYIDGRPDGMLTAELFNWTGHVLMAPRTQIAEALARPEAGYSGVYLLIGELDGEPCAYVGEGEDMAARLRSHDVRKEWWTTAVLVSAAANRLNKAHVRYLEARLIAEARAVGRVLLDNGTSPVPAALSEADVAKMEAFLENLLVVLPAVRVDMFIQRARPAAPAPDRSGMVGSVQSSASFPRFLLQMPKQGIRAEARLQDGEFIVAAGSTARNGWIGTEGSYTALHAELRRSGVLALQGGRTIFTEDYAFRSPSAAAAAILGRSANGQLEWKTATGQSYKDWEARRLGVPEGRTPDADL